MTSQGHDDGEDWLSKLDRGFSNFVERENRASRGYANYWEVATDRSAGELAVAKTLCRHLECIGWTKFRHVELGDDPPDAIGQQADGNTIAIEVTEIVEEEAVKQHRHCKNHGGTPDLANWTEQSLKHHLLEMSEKKDYKLKNVSQNFTTVVLCFYTGEPVVTHEMLNSICSNTRLKPAFIDHVFIIHSYYPGTDESIFPDGCPVWTIESQKIT